MPKTNYFIPNDKWLIQAMNNIGYTFLDIEYPYLNSPYSSLVREHLKFLFKH